MSEKHIDKLISGDIQLTSEITAKLEAVLGIPADFWNNREKIYRDKIVKIEAEKVKLKGCREICQVFKMKHTFQKNVFSYAKDNIQEREL